MRVIPYGEMIAMHRLIIACLAAASLLMSQAATIPHNHGDGLQSDRQHARLSPHFHWRWVQTPQSLSGSIILRDVDVTRHTRAYIAGCSGAAHDADAVYLIAAVATPTGNDGQFVLSPFLQVRRMGELAPGSARCAGGFQPLHPDAWQDDSDLFLRLGYLRI